LQWFVAVNKKFTLANSKIKGIASGSQVTLKELMLAAVQNGDIAITPERFNAVYFHWINNLRDWCISRQIWYGHRIPVWYRGEELHVGSVPNGEGWIQDEDTLDTWFSSGLWTFSTLGWPNETDDLKRFHPTAVLETGYDILFFWVARMILMSGFLLGEVPFKQVYLHGLVRDAKGQKMSKSLGNALDPLELADKYGADATRLSLIIGTSAGNDQKLSEDKVRGYKNFANKIWNISRFVLMNFDGFNPDTAGEITNETDKAAVAEFEKAKAECTAGIEAFNFHASAEGMYHYVWHTFADKVIEEAKPRLADPATRASAQAMLWCILTGSLKALHPFMPFVTEEIWSKLPDWKGKTMLMVEKW
jgi:valyl-tRNA synthetase